MRRKFTQTGIAVLLALFAQVASGQEAAVDRDPFSAPEISEVVRAADRDRVARITSELVEAQMAAIEQRVVIEVEQRLAAQMDRRLIEFNQQLNDLMETRLSEMAGIVSGLRDEVPGQIDKAIAERVRAGSSEAAAMGLLPEGAVFVACVDGKALYRDGAGSTFYADISMGDSSVSRCSN